MAKKSTRSCTIFRKWHWSHSELPNTLFFYQIIVVIQHHFWLTICIYYVFILYLNCAEIRRLRWSYSSWNKSWIRGRLRVLQLHLLKALLKVTTGFIVINTAKRHIFIHGGTSLMMWVCWGHHRPFVSNQRFKVHRLVNMWNVHGVKSCFLLLLNGSPGRIHLTKVRFTNRVMIVLRSFRHKISALYSWAAYLIVLIPWAEKLQLGLLSSRDRRFIRIFRRCKSRHSLTLAIILSLCTIFLLLDLMPLLILLICRFLIF